MSKISTLFFVLIVQHSIIILMIACRALISLCCACVGSNSYIQTYTCKEINFQILFLFMFFHLYCTFRLKLYTSVVVRCGDVGREAILRSALVNCLLLCILLQLQVGGSIVILCLRKISMYMYMNL